MFTFTKLDLLYVAVICLMFGFTFGCFVFVSRTDNEKPFQTVSDLIIWAYDFIVYVCRYLGFLLLLLSPVSYFICHNRGPLTFDNQYWNVSPISGNGVQLVAASIQQIMYLPVQAWNVDFGISRKENHLHYSEIPTDGIQCRDREERIIFTCLIILLPGL